MGRTTAMSNDTLHLINFANGATFCGLARATIPKADSFVRSATGCSCVQCLQSYAGMLESSHSQIRVALGEFLDENPDKAEGLVGDETLAAVVLMLAKATTERPPKVA